MFDKQQFPLSLLFLSLTPFILSSHFNSLIRILVILFLQFSFHPSPSLKKKCDWWGGIVQIHLLTRSFPFTKVARDSISRSVSRSLTFYLWVFFRTDSERNLLHGPRPLAHDWCCRVYCLVFHQSPPAPLLLLLFPIFSTHLGRNFFQDGSESSNYAENSSRTLFRALIRPPTLPTESSKKPSSISSSNVNQYLLNLDLQLPDLPVDAEAYADSTALLPFNQRPSETPLSEVQSRERRQYHNAKRTDNVTVGQIGPHIEIRF